MEDAGIVKLYWERDEKAIEATAEKYGAYCHSVAYQIVNDDEDAAECVNDTYLKAWDSMPPHRPKILRTFLAKITRNLAFNLYKHYHAEKRGRGQMPAVLDELSELVSGNAHGLETPEAAYERRELLEQIEAFLREMPWEKRVMFVRRYWYADSVTQIAKRLKTNPNRVSVTLARLRKALHERLSERGYDL
ncbi:MAG: sigma-70 family RNA polymerase sigma factor [Clostridiales bacterium]|nr:sigma-70 family RNA polymerase sigma factor [Clostridiales bacterium]